MASRDPESPTEHYFTEEPRSPSRRHELRVLYRGEVLSFQVDQSVFASHGLDPGTALLIESLEPGPVTRVLDLGCGWGAIGIAAARLYPDAHVVLTDVNRRAVGLARRNIARNQLKNVEVRAGSLFQPVQGEKFDLIATNPPYHVGREVILRLLAEVPGALRPGGRLLLVGKGSQGILFYQTWLRENFPGSVEISSRGSGYRVVEARLATPGAVPREDSAAGNRVADSENRSA
jgi:16S rRNA (guanine1207-N2)-methyltransferase